MSKSISKGDYVSPLRPREDQNEIGIVDRVRRTRSPLSRDLVVAWLTHSGSSYEFSCGMERLEPNDPRVVAVWTGRTAMPKPSPWLSTAAACERLGVSRWVLATARDGRQLRKGHHWKVKNPTAQRLTYLWHVERLEKWQSSVTVDPREQLATIDQVAGAAGEITRS